MLLLNMSSWSRLPGGPSADLPGSLLLAGCGDDTSPRGWACIPVKTPKIFISRPFSAIALCCISPSIIEWVWCPKAMPAIRRSR